MFCFYRLKLLDLALLLNILLKEWFDLVKSKMIFCRYIDLKLLSRLVQKIFQIEQKPALNLAKKICTLGTPIDFLKSSSNVIRHDFSCIRLLPVSYTQPFSIHQLFSTLGYIHQRTIERDLYYTNTNRHLCNLLHRST